MTDLEITRLCAEAMGYQIYSADINGLRVHIRPQSAALMNYDPLHDDAQAMALVKRLCLYISGSGGATGHKRYWQVSYDDLEYTNSIQDLNRSICECVAKMQREKQCVL